MLTGALQDRKKNKKIQYQEKNLLYLFTAYLQVTYLQVIWQPVASKREHVMENMF